MATHLISRQLIFQNENSDAHLKKAVVDGKGKISKTTIKKGGLGSRKALNDITNKSTIHHEASSRKKKLPKEEFHFGEEMFLHDHKKCLEAQQNAAKPCFLDTVLPGHDSASLVRNPMSKAKTDLDSPRCYPEPVELPNFESSVWLESSTRWNSPPSSPIRWDSPPSSPLAWHLEPVEFVLK